MDRRIFLKQVMLWSAGISNVIPNFHIVSDLLAAEKPSPLVSHAKGKDYYRLVERVLKPLGSINKFVNTGDRVVIKPNMSWDRSPAQGANTHPQVVKALVELCLDAGAKQVRVFDRTCNEERRCYVNSGVQKTLESVKDKRLKLFHPDSRKF